MLGLIQLSQISQNNILGIYFSLAITLVLVAAITLLLVWFIPMISELKSLIIGLAVMITIALWIKINLFP